MLVLSYAGIEDKNVHSLITESDHPDVTLCIDKTSESSDLSQGRLQLLFFVFCLNTPDLSATGLAV